MAIHVNYMLDINQIPRRCITDCSASGSVDQPVAYWREELGFTVDRDSTIKCLKGYGAWGPEELADMSDDDLADKVLWLACCNFGEYIHEAEEASIDPFGDRGDFEPRCGSDVFVLE